jgi:hypothetical protein
MYSSVLNAELKQTKTWKIRLGQLSKQNC